jgi:hypothetical protein
LEEISRRLVPNFARNWIAVHTTKQSNLNKKMETKNMTTLYLRKSIGRSPLRRGFLLISLVLGCFALLPTVRAQLNPAPDGDYPDRNTAEGEDALFSLTRGGTDNTAIGFNALYFNTTGSANTASGRQALYRNETGFQNTANGSIALTNNTTGGRNTAVGDSALFSNTSGVQNTANGVQALASNIDGDDNTANGDEALFSNETGNQNTANGRFALAINTTGSQNTANGVNALFNTTGNSNIALGFGAGSNLTTGDNNIDIGNGGVAAEANTIRIGTTGTQTNAYIAGIYNATVAKGVGVVVDSTGHLGTKGSSERFKDAIKPMNKASEAIHALKPVTFHYKKEIDLEGIPQFGLVAEEVAKVNPDLVARDDQGEIYTVRYDAVNAMLLNEFLKEHRKGEEQDRQLQKQAAAIAKQQKQIDALTTRLQKVNDKLELSIPAPRTVENNQ